MSGSDKIKQNLDCILKTVNSENVRIVAVSKYYGFEKIEDAYKAGLRDFAESRALEALEKINKLEDEIKAKSTYHFIGHLQTNKVKSVVGNFEYIHSVDSYNLACEISKVAQKKNITQKILVQVNVADEKSKFGVAPSKLNSLVEEIKKLSSVELVGLMNIAPLDISENELKAQFLLMKELKEKYNLSELSMGMSNDYKLAVECGATMIRLGRVLLNNL